MNEKYKKKLSNNLVIANQVISDRKVILLTEGGKTLTEVKANKNDWIVIDEDGEQLLYTDELFKSQFERYKEILHG
ncbi:MAG TPA: hypothetical protein DC057_14950 [Spirochaetia bacterium]|nr:hypothetical protein [Spirochaetia bacterium]